MHRSADEIGEESSSATTRQCACARASPAAFAATTSLTNDIFIIPRRAILKLSFGRGLDLKLGYQTFSPKLPEGLLLSLYFFRESAVVRLAIRMALFSAAVCICQGSHRQADRRESILSTKRTEHIMKSWLAQIDTAVAVEDVASWSHTHSNVPNIAAATFGTILPVIKRWTKSKREHVTFSDSIFRKIFAREPGCRSAALFSRLMFTWDQGKMTGRPMARSS